MLQVTGISKSYGAQPVLNDISFTLNTGEHVGLVGPNGAGKTTTFYMIVGLIRPDAGHITLDGADISALPMYKRY